jgi:hypothetical protein
MITIEEMEVMLDELASQLPEVIYEGLNGGILLLPQEKHSPVSQEGDLYILGEYHINGQMGRYIAIYYGSFLRVYGGLSPEALKRKLDHTLKHEFTHHLESRAGERGLEIEDARYIEKYLRNKG